MVAVLTDGILDADLWRVRIVRSTVRLMDSAHVEQSVKGESMKGQCIRTCDRLCFGGQRMSKWRIGSTHCSNLRLRRRDQRVAPQGRPRSAEQGRGARAVVVADQLRKVSLLREAGVRSVADSGARGY